MSENADTIRQGIDDFNAFMRGELSVEAYAERFDPQIELLWRDRQTFPDFPQHLRGLAEVIAHAEQYRDGWIDLVYEPLELTEVPDGRIVVFVRQSGRGRQSDVPIVIHYFTLYTVRDGKVRKIEYFRHRADAVQAAGLERSPVSANLQLVRSIYADWERGDFLTSFAWAHPEVEFIVADGPEPGRWKGLADLEAAFRERMSAWDDYHFIADEIKNLDDERVLALNRRSGRGKESGLDIGQMQSAGVNLFYLREGKVTNLVVYWDRERGLADLGLEG